MIINFFDNSCFLDYMVLRPLSHIKGNWELTWDPVNNQYMAEEDSYAEQLNQLICEIEQSNPGRYHDNEDSLAEYVIKSLNWQLKKEGSKWKGEDYPVILEQGGFHDPYEKNLILAAAGRISAAIKHGQKHFDEMERSHQEILAAILAIILYHRS